MKACFLALVCTACFHGALAAKEPEPTPLAVVKQRMHALNAHDLETFLSTYAEDVSIFVYPDRQLGKGKSHLRKIFAPMIRNGEVHVKIGTALTTDSYVVVESTTSFGSIAEPSVAIYEVRDGLIQSVRFLRDTIRARQVEAKPKVSN